MLFTEDKVIFGGTLALPNTDRNEIPMCGLHRNKYLRRVKDAKCTAKNVTIADSTALSTI